jgi:hypothetical protein
LEPAEEHLRPCAFRITDWCSQDGERELCKIGASRGTSAPLRFSDSKLSPQDDERELCKIGASRVWGRELCKKRDIAPLMIMIPNNFSIL